MAKTMKTSELVKKVVNLGFITEREILLLKRRMNHGEYVDLSVFEDNDIFVTDEQAVKGLNYLRRHLLTTRNVPRVRCKWSLPDLQAIGYQGDNNPLLNLNVHKLFKFEGFEDVSCGFTRYVEPVYRINGVRYSMAYGEPKTF